MIIRALARTAPGTSNAHVHQPGGNAAFRVDARARGRAADAPASDDDQERVGRLLSLGFLAKERSWRTAWRARSLLSWTKLSSRFGRRRRRAAVSRCATSSGAGDVLRGIASGLETARVLSPVPRSSAGGR